MPKITRTILIINVAVFLLELWYGETVIANFALWPVGKLTAPGFSEMVGFDWWQLFTSAFLHANLLHLGLNMYALLLFGGDVERTLGSRTYIWLYTISLLTAALVQLATVSLMHSPVPFPTVGASGAIFGILLAYGTLFPQRQLLLLFPPIPLRARTFVFLYAAIELISGIVGTESGIAHFAHLGGMLGGFLVLQYWRHTSTALR